MTEFNDAAVEAAARAVYNRGAAGHDRWGIANPTVQDLCRGDVRTALTAALPHLRKDWEAPDDAALDSLVTLIRDAARGGCGSHDECRALVRTHQRNAARRWFIDRTPEVTP